MQDTAIYKSGDVGQPAQGGGPGVMLGARWALWHLAPPVREMGSPGLGCFGTGGRDPTALW